MARRKKKVIRTPKAARRAARKRRSGVAERRKKEFTYRGYSVAELKDLPVFAPDEDPDALSVESIMPSRARRSMSRGYERGITNGGSNSDEEHFINRMREDPDKKVRTHCRSLYILPEMVGRTIGIHDGRQFKMVDILPEMIGHALGEYAPTRRSVTHTGPGVGATRSSKHVALK
ncbi:MAG: ribosomal protein S19 family protein [Candidatus Thalassarchaeaceae archaeon]|jgi:small subunit ribosomal protein S19|nr:ribosomal protein S19 family protein [Candidatus Thalassarchaeaceae archaeon]